MGSEGPGQPGPDDAPLAGFRIVAFAGIGPGPFAGMMLADMGAGIIRVNRPGAQGRWTGRRESNLLDGGAPWCGVYECADGAWISIAPVEEKFRHVLLDLLGIRTEAAGNRDDPETWPALRGRLAHTFRSQPRAHWAARLDGTDACFAPVLIPDDAPEYPHNAARGIFGQDGAPRFARAATPVPPPGRAPGSDTNAVLGDLGLSGDDIARATGRVA